MFHIYIPANMGYDLWAVPSKVSEDTTTNGRRIDCVVESSRHISLAKGTAWGP